MSGPREALIRARQGMTQEEVAKKAGISRAAYANIERGNRTPSLPVAMRIAKVLGQPVDVLFAGLGVTERNNGAHSSQTTSTARPGISGTR